MTAQPHLPYFSPSSHPRTKMTTPPNTPEPDITFDEFLEQALQYPCPCEECSPDLPFHTIEEAQRSLNYYREIWELLTENPSFDYEPPPTSPTNQEMHAINGNIQHQRKLLHLPRPDTPFVRDVVDVLNGAHEMYQEIPQIIEHLRGQGKYSSDDAMRHYKKYFANKGKFYDAGTPEYDEWWNEYQQSLKPSKLNKMKKITNKEQHAKNGNWDWNPAEKNIKKQLDKFPKPIPAIKKSPKDKTKKINAPKWEWKPAHPPQVNLMDSDVANDTKEVFDHLQAGDNPAKILAETGPTNKEMHAYNGNFPKFGPRTRAQHARTERKKIRNAKKKAETKAYLKVIKAGAGRFPLNKPRAKMPKGVKKAGKLETREDRLAAAYNRAVHSPSMPPPRLGSTGSTPTKLIHGFYKRIIPMSNIDFGTNPTLGNATSFVCFLSPVMFKNFSSSTSYKSPITIGCAATNAKKFDDTTGGAGFASLLCEDFTNTTEMKNETLGTSSNSTVSVGARWLTGSVSVECRCPMSTTAPPFIFGGLYPSNVAWTTNTRLADVSKQLSTQTGAQLEQLQSTSEIQGFSGSAVYVPSTADSLLFSGSVAMNDSAFQSLPLSAIPYIAMNGCPTSATIVVTVSCWFEIQQTKDNCYYGGWKLGPKVSTEDIFDRLKRTNAVSKKVIDQGAKTVEGGALSATAQVEANLSKQQHTAPQPSLLDEIKILKEELRHLRVKIEEDEDEKYFECEATPTLDKQEIEPFKGLSKSTIDLAMSIKKSLTPGSVTNKTVHNSFQ